MPSAESRYAFDPQRFQGPLLAVFEALDALPEGRVDTRTLQRILRRHTKPDGRMFSKAELIKGFRALQHVHGLAESAFVERVRMKPVRSQSGVAVVTVLTKPFPCPGRCIFCPNDVRMPKSYLSMEPGAQRATQNRFDPFAQTWSRLTALHVNGHPTDKIELIVLGGTWSFYPEPYRIWFIRRCLDALNVFSGAAPLPAPEGHDFLDLDDAFDPKTISARSYNDVVRRHLVSKHGALLSETEHADWEVLEAAQRENERAACRMVGLVLETRPDHVTAEEVVNLRRLGCTKVQVGVQSMSDEVLELNRRGHDVSATRAAIQRLRRAGFKIHVHWMPNLYGATPHADREDFLRLFSDPALRPDELKMYPCSLIETAELMTHYEAGRWRPYSRGELLDVLAACLPEVPEYCRVTRVIRDIPSHDIVVGNKESNFREVATREALGRGARLSDIRSREIRGDPVAPDALELDEQIYDAGVTEEHFLQFVTVERRIAGFLRLSLPREAPAIAELEGAALIREVHVYGPVVGFKEIQGPHAQHVGLGRRLIARAREIARARGFDKLSVISSVGTRGYYRAQGFTDGVLYQSQTLCHPE